MQIFVRFNAIKLKIMKAMELDLKFNSESQWKKSQTNSFISGLNLHRTYYFVIVFFKV